MTTFIDNILGKTTTTRNFVFRENKTYKPMESIKQSTILQTRHFNPSSAIKIQKPQISVQNMAEGHKNLQINRSTTPLKKELNLNNSAMSDLSTNTSFSSKSIASEKITRDTQYKNAYGSLKTIIQKQPLIGKCLQNCQVTPLFRSKMVNWMMEVFATFSDKTSDSTFFRAVLIMDLFFKHYRNSVLTNSDVFLTGLTCIWISSKYTDISSISLAEYSHYKVNKDMSINQIKEYEFTVLMSLGFQISLPVLNDFIELFCQLFLENVSRQFAEQFQYFCVVVAKMCLLNVEFNEFGFEVLSLSIIMFVLRFVEINETVYVQSIRTAHLNSSHTSKELQRQITAKIGQKCSEVENCCLLVKLHVQGFSTNFAKFDNVFRYNKKFTMKVSA